MKKHNDNVKKSHKANEKSSKTAKNQPKVEYKTLDEVFEIIKSEVAEGKYKSLVAPMNDQNDNKLIVDNDYMVEFQQKYSLIKVYYDLKPGIFDAILYGFYCIYSAYTEIFYERRTKCRRSRTGSYRAGNEPTRRHAHRKNE